jgi:hypothetical protein
MSFFSATRRTLLVGITFHTICTQLNRSLLDQPSEITHQLLQKPDPVSSLRSCGNRANQPDLPLAFAAAGLAGLGGYVYLQRNPAVAEKAEGKLNELKGEAKASNESPAAAGALIK